MENIYLKVIERHCTNMYESTPWYSAAKAIADMNREFMEWVRENCKSDLITSVQNTHVTYEFKWYIVSEVDDWDGKPNRTLTDDDLFKYWWENIYSKKLK